MFYLSRVLQYTLIDMFFFIVYFKIREQWMTFKIVHISNLIQYWMEHSPQYTSPSTQFSFIFASHILYIRFFFSSIKCQIEVLVLLIKKRVSLIYYHLDNRLLLYLGFVSHQNCHIYCNYSKWIIIYPKRKAKFCLRDKMIFNI